MLKLLLKGLGYHVLLAISASEALAIAGQNHLDLIVTDYGLPDLNGIALVRRIRTLNDRLRQVPIIMLTAFGGSDYSHRALRAGCAVFLTKPIDFEKLEANIESLLGPRIDERAADPDEVQVCEP